MIMFLDIALVGCVVGLVLTTGVMMQNHLHEKYRKQAIAYIESL